MEEFNFRRPMLEDKELIDHYFKTSPSRSCERTFVNVFLWAKHYGVGFAIINDTMVFQGTDEQGNLSFTYPAGAPEKVKGTLDILMQYTEEKGQPFSLYSVTPEAFAELEKWYPDTFQIEYNRDDADYVYESEKLATLSGKKLHGKRNHINKFKSLYEDWSYEPLSKENLEACFQMALKWRNGNGCNDDTEKNAEMCVTLNSLRLFEELGQVGGILRVNGEIVAFTIGEPICDDTFVVHIEKAYADIEGAYPMINQQFVQHECTNFQYVNREEDTGAEGLRTAKLSYRPVFLVEKGFVTKK